MGLFQLITGIWLNVLHLCHNRRPGPRGQSMGLDEQIKARCYNRGHKK